MSDLKFWIKFCTYTGLGPSLAKYYLCTIFKNYFWLWWLCKLYVVIFFRCQYCDKGFSLRSMLDQHVLAKHTEVKPFICESCGKGFVTQSSLNNHLKKHQDCEKQEFPCTECGKILYTRGGLTSHMNAHKLGRRFMCDPVSYTHLDVYKRQL